MKRKEKKSPGERKSFCKDSAEMRRLLHNSGVRQKQNYVHEKNTRVTVESSYSLSLSLLPLSEPRALSPFLSRTPDRITLKRPI